ncbi:DeoR/GlpR family DNA-binding transcription regulator [Rhodococcus opacus]|uniref:DeoR/GlpR family DNA-binding transcription regulator n=1 Tax=Rhodococcus opacus TaxID=37919 RepID=UPI001C48857B|nr:DeoR/GlpR family DNA-binding transcription regulator [Rhodococcus opacus]MBV6760391.1 DeoR/GlpR family DNA-binding transcription regulator [Rhodococcus opacus]
MLAKERRTYLTDEIARNGRVITSEMSAKLGVSEVTIRADLDELERQGRVRRTHGGATAPDLSSAVVAFDTRMSMYREEKRRIALEAAKYVLSNQTVIFDAGTTVQALAQAMPEVSGLRVFTPGLTLAHQLLTVEGVETYLMGGRIDPDWGETTGSPSEQGIEDVIAHTLFLGAMGVDSSLDIVDNSTSLATNKLQFARRARTIVLLMDSSKWECHGAAKVMPLSRIDVVITDSGIPDTVRQQITDKTDVDLIVV